MYPHKPQLDLPKLRCQLEELLAMVTTGLNVEGENHTGHVRIIETVQRNNELSEFISVTSTESNETKEMGNGRELLYDDALVVITEFGHASAAILQMWLSIDYRRATKILNQFQEDGLISAKGRVRHKAFVLRHSLVT